MKYEKYHPVREVHSVKEMLTSGAEIYEDKPAFLVKEKKGGEYREISFAKFRNDVEALGTCLMDMGLRGEKIAVIGPNCYQWIMAYFSIICGTGIAVPLDKELSSSEILNLVRKAGCKAAFFTPGYRECFENSGVEHLFEMDPYEDPDRKDFIGHILQMADEGRKLLNAGDRRFLDAEIKTDEMCEILFTSGTTGDPKGVMLSHDNLVFVITNTSRIVHLRNDDRVLSILPVHHTFECTIGIMTVLFQGCSIAFCEGLKYIVKNMQEFRTSVIIGVPLIVETIYEKIWKQAEKTGRAKALRMAVKANRTLLVLGIDKRRTIFKSIYGNFGGRLRMVISGAAAMDPNVLRGFVDLGFDVAQGYGLTETAPLISGTPDFENIYKKAGSAGQVIPGGEIRIDAPDEDGIGEILYRGPNVMLGYYDMPEKTAEVMRDGWFCTGDLGFLDKDGWLYITGRKKNVIVTKTGKNIYPEELEALIDQIPQVKEAMVYGRETEDSADITVAVQVLIDKENLEETMGGDPAPEVMHAFIKDRIHEINSGIPSYKRIRHIIIREKDFIRTSTNKIKRGSNI